MCMMQTYMCPHPHSASHMFTHPHADAPFSPHTTTGLILLHLTGKSATHGAKPAWPRNGAVMKGIVRAPAHCCWFAYTHVYCSKICRSMHVCGFTCVRNYVWEFKVCMCCVRVRTHTHTRVRMHVRMRAFVRVCRCEVYAYTYGRSDILVHLTHNLAFNRCMFWRSLCSRTSSGSRSPNIKR